MLIQVVFYMKSGDTIRRTCGSVRSSLAALARGVTPGSKAAVTSSHPHHEAGLTVKCALSLIALIGHRDRLIGKSNVSELSKSVVNTKEPKTLVGSDQNGKAVSCLLLDGKHTDHRTAGILSETKPIVYLYRNRISPISCLHWAGVSVRSTDEIAGMRGWKKQMLFCNGTDRRRSSTRKCAHFQLVVNDERVRRTCLGGNVK